MCDQTVPIRSWHRVEMTSRSPFCEWATSCLVGYWKHIIKVILNCFIGEMKENVGLDIELDVSKKINVSTSSTSKPKRKTSSHSSFCAAANYCNNRKSACSLMEALCMSQIVSRTTFHTVKMHFCVCLRNIVISMECWSWLLQSWLKFRFLLVMTRFQNRNCFAFFAWMRVYSVWP